MPAKPSNRKSPARKPAAPTRATGSTQRKAAADRDDRSALARARAKLPETTRPRETRVVVTALVTGFSLGLFLGGLLVHSKMRGHWPDRSALQATGRRILHQMESHIPESIRDKVGLG